MANFLNFAGTINQATGLSIVNLCSAPTDQSMGVVSLRIGLLFPPSNTFPHTANIYLRDGTTDYLIRKLPLRNYQDSGTYIDIIPQFNLSPVFGLAPQWSIGLGMQSVLSNLQSIVYFGIGEVAG